MCGYGPGHGGQEETASGAQGPASSAVMEAVMLDLAQGVGSRVEYSEDALVSRLCVLDLDDENHTTIRS